jgi:hypothetical protein
MVIFPDLAQLLQDLAHLQVRVLHEALPRKQISARCLLSLPWGMPWSTFSGLPVLGLLAEDPFLLTAVLGARGRGRYRGEGCGVQAS